MNQRDGFGSGFIAGTLVGGVIGGIVGAVVASWRTNVSTQEEDDDVARRLNPKLSDAKNLKEKRRQLKAPNSEASIEVARRSLEDKIAQLNETIDEFRLSLGNVNGNPSAETSKQSFSDQP